MLRRTGYCWNGIQGRELSFPELLDLHSMGLELRRETCKARDTD